MQVEAASVRERSRIVLSLGLLGMLMFSGGCDGGGSGESNVSPTTPPPGQSAKEQAEARAKSFPASKQAAAAAKKN